jgi:DNA adenine methylase
MKYMGSKSRIVASIAPILQSYVDKSEKHIYYEPFCGGCNVIDHISADQRIAADNQPYLIALYQNLHRMAELPDFVTKEHYDAVRNDYNQQRGLYEPWYIGAIGFLASYNGRFFDGGYAGLVHTKIGTERNYYAEAKRNLEAQIPDLDGILFDCLDYAATPDYTGYVMYCDPPYARVKKYGSSKGFVASDFWQWVRRQSAANTVIVSEQQAPDDFQCIWEQSVTRTIDNNQRKQATEKLWMWQK